MLFCIVLLYCIVVFFNCCTVGRWAILMPSDCDCECDCVQRENLLVLRMEKVLKKFIISLRNKDRKDFKKYYKTGHSTWWMDGIFVCLPIATSQFTESVRWSFRGSDSTLLPSFVFKLISTWGFSVMQSLDATFQTKTFCELRLEEVVFLLSCDDLSVETEDRVFDMIIHWIAIDVATRRGGTHL